ncbi:MAG: hypothetical protein IJR04_10015 [Bacteroidales bacterium]|nr:hypothetical protein [Bacteroidales bacterium]
MKRIIIALSLLSFHLSLFTLSAQTDWKKIDNLIVNKSYKTAYTQAEVLFKKTTNSTDLLTAAWYMTRAAAEYQEDCYDSSIARYRSILSRLEAPEKAVCYAWLGVADSALMDEALLKKTSSDRIKPFLEKEEHGKRGVNLTPMVFDVVAQYILNNVVYDSFALMQELIDFHSGDNDDIRILLDMQLMQMTRAHRPNEVTGEEWLQRYINKYRGSRSQQLTKLYCEMARILSNKERYVEAVAYCDTAIRLFPTSSGAVECFNMRKEILAQRIDIQASYLTIVGRPSLHVLEFKNLSKVHLALYPYKQTKRNFEFPEKLGKPLHEWQLELEDNGDHKEKKAIFHLPALEMGTYLLVVSENDKFSQKDAYTVINSTDFLLLRNGEDFQLVEAVSGDPIEGQEVVLLEWYDQEPVDTAISYPDGRFRLDKDHMQKLCINRKGHSFLFDYYHAGYGQQGSRTMTEHAKLLTDRPIYRPGDTAHIAALLYESDGVNGRTVGGRELSLRFDTPNGKRYADWKLRTDAHGVADTVFVIPTDVLTGQWAVTLYDEGRRPPYLGYVYLRVEEYKQPKFMVTIDDPADRQDAGGPSLGVPYTLRGRATAYSGANLGGAKVRYTITRETRYWFRVYEQSKYFSFIDSTTTANDGSFDITFTPQPDSGIDLSRKPNFRFRINVDVTDLNGETHSASASFVIGYCNEQIAIRSPRHDISALNQVQLTYTDLNRRPLKGKVYLNLYHLRQSDTLRLEHPVIAHNSDAQMTLSRSEFQRFFPQYAYSFEEGNCDAWESDIQYSTTLRPDGTEDLITVPIGDRKLPSGLYRIVARTDNVADTVYVCLTLPKEKEIANGELLWARFDTTSAAPGDRVTLGYASAFEDTRFFYTLTGPEGDEIDSRWIPAGRRIKHLSIPIDSSMLGGIHVRLTTVRDGIDMEWTEKIDVPFTHKRLNVDIATFRDKLLPGEQEEWKIRVSECQSGQVTKSTLPFSHSATLVMTMYDDALNSYGSRYSWSLNPWRTSFINNYSRIDLGRYNRSYYQQFEYQRYDGPSPYSLTLRSDFTEAYRFRGRRMYKNAEILPEVSTAFELAAEEEEEEMVFTVTDGGTARGESNMVTMQGNVRKRTANYEEVVLQTGAEEEADEATSTSDLIPPTSTQLRTNLSTLAFFVAGLHTDSAGTATYRFTVPELLTRWKVKGFAYTDDLKSGTLERTLVTQKPLMVQPNIPRFLRQGDSIVLMAKVMVVEPKDTMDVRVTFRLTDAATGNLLTLQYQKIKVKDAKQLTFDFRVPKDVYVATYEIVAEAEGMSDGERGQIPVVSSRQAVTLSQPIYINGVGEKSFAFHLSSFSPTAEPHLLGAELVSNPIWLAIKSMPYLQETGNPSNLYLANRLYVNNLAKEILVNLGNLEKLENLADMANTRLKINEDVKQTLLEATPWLRDAESEVEQRRAIANYFDSTRMAEELERIQTQLDARQNNDGGWSWMPDGESSLWVTEQVLKRINLTTYQLINIEKALAYIDREEQRHYEKYIKPYLKKGYKWSPDNIDYLYTRSHYGNGKTEAYKFYYGNALKNYKSYNGLYTQAQLALIFQRHGDKKAALDIIRILKEKSLESDEMGMYWRDNKSGWCWYERPIETQALLIQAFAEVTPQDTTSIALMQQWLLKQKQTNHWGNDRATVEAIKALLVQNTPSTPILQNNQITLKVCGTELSAPSEGLEGYRSQRWQGPALDSIISLNDSTITLRKETPGIAWGAVYYQYTDDMDKIPSSESGITLKRSYFPEGNWKVGDRVKVHIEISCDRTMEYLELIDGRPSCVEPVSTRSGWNWNQGLRYYVEVKNTATHCYINRLEKGKYVVEYDVFVTNPGTFLAGPVTLQCMYAPEFRATAPAERFVIR